MGAIVLEYFDGSFGDNYLLGTIMPYLESLHFSCSHSFYMGQSF
jgi:hypothetical protein